MWIKLMRITLQNRCPYCNSSNFFQIPRKFYMRISDQFKHYECDLCRREFVIYEKNSEEYEEQLLDRAS
jgi:transposase-like protein